ncbi:MAG: hypothetical protein ACI81A_002545, partial [Paraglaciecola sp.]
HKCQLSAPQYTAGITCSQTNQGDLHNEKGQ